MLARPEMRVFHRVPAASFGLFAVLAVFCGLIFFFLQCCPSFSCFSDINCFSEQHFQTILQMLLEGQFVKLFFVVISFKVRDWCCLQRMLRCYRNHALPFISPLLIRFLTLLQSLFTNSNLAPDAPPFTQSPALCISKGRKKNNSFLALSSEDCRIPGPVCQNCTASIKHLHRDISG